MSRSIRRRTATAPKSRRPCATDPLGLAAQKLSERRRWKIRAEAEEEVRRALAAAAAAPWPERAAPIRDVQDTGRRPMALMSVRAGRVRRGARRDEGAIRMSWRSARTSAAAACSASTRACSRSSARERVIDTPISEATILGAGGRHGARRAAAGGRDARGRLRAVRDGRDRQPGRQEPLHVRRPGPRAAGGAHADRHVERARRRSIRSSWKPGSRTCPGLVVVMPATPQDNYSLLRAALDCGDPVSTWSTRSCGDARARSTSLCPRRSARRASCRKATT